MALVLFTLFGCENENLKENSPEQNTDQPSKAKIDKLSMDELSKDKQFNEISSVFKLDETFETAKKGVTKKETLDKNDFEIDFSSANKMESKVGTSYTFMIKNGEEIPKHFENLVVEKHNDGTISGFIVYYEYSQRYMDSLKKGKVIPFDGTSRRTANKENLQELIDFFKQGKTAKSSMTAKSTELNCIETRYVTQSLCPAGIHSSGQYCDVINGIWYGYHLETKLDCISTSSTTNHWGWVADSQSYTSTVPDPNVSSGGGSYSTTATVQPSLFSDVSAIQSFVNTYGLTGNEVEWARYIPNRSVVNSYMDDNDYTELAKATVKNVISQIVANTSLKIDFVSSLNSPMNIDKTAITDATPEGKKFNTVYDALTKSPEFKKLFVDLFDNNSRFNVKFELVDHAYKDNDPTKEEVNATTTQNSSAQIITIKISKQIFISSNTKLEIAKTILHECIHAYLYVKAINPSIGVDFVTVFKNKYPTKNEQHDFMYNKMIPTMQTVLSQIRDLVTTPEGRAYVEQLTMHPTTNPLTSTPWNWTDYYKYVSINGLEETDCFKEHYPKNTDQWDLYANYVNYGHAYLKP